MQKPNADGPIIDVPPAAAVDLEREVQTSLTQIYIPQTSLHKSCSRFQAQIANISECVYMSSGKGSTVSLQQPDNETVFGLLKYLIQGCVDHVGRYMYSQQIVKHLQ